MDGKLGFSILGANAALANTALSKHCLEQTLPPQPVNLIIDVLVEECASSGDVVALPLWRITSAYSMQKLAGRGGVRGHSFCSVRPLHRISY